MILRHPGQRHWEIRWSPLLSQSPGFSMSSLAVDQHLVTYRVSMYHFHPLLHHLTNGQKILFIFSISILYWYLVSVLVISICIIFSIYLVVFVISILYRYVVFVLVIGICVIFSISSILYLYNLVFHSGI